MIFDMNKISIFQNFDGRVQFVSITMNRVMPALTQKLDSMSYVTIPFHYSFKKHQIFSKQFFVQSSKRHKIHS